MYLDPVNKVLKYCKSTIIIHAYFNELINHNSSLTGPLRFLEFGSNRRYITNHDDSDATSEPISLPFGFPFGSDVHTLAFVSL